MSLESRDIVQKWFYAIHNKSLNTKRTIEINAAAKQAREYFNNSFSSNYSVKPLLTYYGVASLSRALILLFRSSGGEECLSQSHGLSTVNWNDIFSGQITPGLNRICELEVKTCNGLFNDLLITTKNRTSIHARSSTVDWHLLYDSPPLGSSIKLIDLFQRIPDLENENAKTINDCKFAYVNAHISYSKDAGFSANIGNKIKPEMLKRFSDFGYQINPTGQAYNLTCNGEIFEKHMPLFYHKYIDKTFNTIPTLYLVDYFNSNHCYSELCSMFILSYYLGMIVRYYPTYWISLIQGEKGDMFWPMINRAQQLIEQVYPELVVEMIHDVLKENKQ